MTHDARDHAQTDLTTRPLSVWIAPMLVEYGDVAGTAITNCGVGSDGVICQAVS